MTEIAVIFKGPEKEYPRRLRKAFSPTDHLYQLIISTADQILSVTGDNSSYKNQARR